MLAKLIADLFLVGLVIAIFVTFFFIAINSRDARAERLSIEEQYRRAQKKMESTNSATTNKIVGTIIKQKPSNNYISQRGNGFSLAKKAAAHHS